MDKLVVGVLMTVAIIGLVIGVVALQAWVFQLIANFALEQFHHDFRVTFYQALAGSLVLSLVGGYFRSSSTSSSTK